MRSGQQERLLGPWLWDVPGLSLGGPSVPRAETAVHGALEPTPVRALAAPPPAFARTSGSLWHWPLLSRTRFPEVTRPPRSVCKRKPQTHPPILLTPVCAQLCCCGPQPSHLPGPNLPGRAGCPSGHRLLGTCLCPASLCQDTRQ